MKVEIKVALKQGVLDPEAQAIEGALKRLGFEGVAKVERSKSFFLDIDENDAEKVRSEATKMAEQLLANTVIERFSVEIIG